MSQSDYLKYKRVSTVLKIDSNFNKLPPVFSEQDYLNYKEYTLLNTIVNTKTISNDINPVGKQIIFDMVKTVGNCPRFIDCSGTNLRSNRVPISTVYFTPTPQPLTIKQTKHGLNLKNACNCKFVSANIGANICNCKIGYWGIVR